MTRVKADWERARETVPYVDDGDWRARLAENPDALYRIIADSYDFVLREREAANGIKRPGRRPRPSQVPLDEVLQAVFPTQYSNEPFPVALEELMGGRSQRAFSALIPCNQATLSRLLAGQLRPDVTMLEGCARAGGVPPWYFVEWRAEYVAALVRETLVERPTMGIQAVRALQRMARSS